MSAGVTWRTRDVRQQSPTGLNSPSDVDHISTCFVAVEAFDLFRAMLQHSTLIDVGLVGDFSCGQ